MFRPFLLVLRGNSARRLFLATFLGALPISTATLSVLLLVQQVSQSLSQAGLVSGALTAGNAVGLVAQGRLIDAYGVTRVLRVSSVGCLVLFAAFTFAALTKAPAVELVPLAAAAGVAIPAVLTSVRLGWPRILPDAANRSTAYALMSIQCQICSIAGPLMVSVIANPAVCVVLTGALGAIAASLPSGRPRRATAVAPANGLGKLLAVSVVIGASTGMVTVAIPASVLGHGKTVALTGLLFTCLAIGNLIGGICYGARRWHIPVVRRLVWAQLAGSLALAALALAPPVAMVPVLLVFGAVISVPAVTISTLLDAVSPKERLARSYTLIVAAGLVGSAVGSALGGMLADAAVIFATAAALLAAGGVFTRCVDFG